MLNNKNSATKSKLFLILGAITPVLGAASTLFFKVPASFLVLYLGFFAGFLLYIGASDILPEAHAERLDWTPAGIARLACVQTTPRRATNLAQGTANASSSEAPIAIWLPPARPNDAAFRWRSRVESLKSSGTGGAEPTPTSRATSVDSAEAQPRRRSASRSPETHAREARGPRRCRAPWEHSVRQERAAALQDSR